MFVKTTATNINDNSIVVRDGGSDTQKYGLYSPLPLNFHKIPMDYNQFLHKPLFIDRFTWSTSSAALSTLGTVSIPRDIINTNTFLAVPWNTSCFYRLKGKVVIQVAGTVRHSGILLAAAVPYTSAPDTINELMAVPHAFVYANQANPAVVEVPFYNPSPLRQTNALSRACRLAIGNDSADSYADIRLLVMNQLSAPTGGSTSVIVTVHMVLDALEFYTPTPTDILYTQSSVITQAMDGITSILKKKTSDAIDNIRGTVKEWTGLHNQNISVPTDKHFMQTRANANIVDGFTTYDSLSPYTMDQSAVTTAPLFHTKVDEMDIQYLLSIPQCITSRIPISLTSNVGDLLFARPITPFMGVSAASTAPALIDTIQSKLAYCASHWSGDMELMLQVDMSNMQYLKLMVVLDYSRNRNNTNLGTNGQPAFSSFHGTLTHTLEFAGGGTIQCVSLPFMSAYRQLPLTTDWRANALSHGMVRVYVLQPPAVADDVAVPELNVYYKCKPNFQLYGISHRRALSSVTGPVPSSVMSSEVDLMEVQSHTAELSQIATVTDQECTDVPGSESTQVVYGPGNLRPLVSVRDIARRLYHVSCEELTPSTTNVNNYMIIPVQSLFRTRQSGFNYTFPGGKVSPLTIISDLFYGYRGSMKVKLMITGANTSAVHYYPPGVSVTTDSGSTIYTMTTPLTTNTTILNDETKTCIPFADPLRAVPVTTVQEMSDFNRRPSIVHSSTGIGSLADSVSIHDVEVPYMSHADFITNDSRLARNPSSAFSSTDSMGYLKVSFTPMIVSPAGSTVVLSKVHINVFAGCGDDARFGMVVGARSFTPYFALDGTVPTQLDPIQHTTTTLGNTTVPLQIAASGAPKAYEG